MRSSFRTVVTAVLAAMLLVPAVSVTTAAEAAIPRPPTPVGLTAAIEPLAHYVGQVACDPVGRPGTQWLAAMLMRVYRGTYAATNYPCGTNGSRSEHYDGRAIDWMVSVRNPTEYAQAKAVISWLLATDRLGNKFAMARRIGLQYLIYNNKIWGSYRGAWEPYENCAKLPKPSSDSYCHRNHVHISLSWNGANARTTFWTRRVSSFDYGPCRSSDLNWGPRWRWANLNRCPYYPKVNPAARASAVKRALVTYSGATTFRGRTGPVVSAVQAALRIPVTGTFSYSTKVALIDFQHRRRIPATGWMDGRTWRALLAAVR